MSRKLSNNYFRPGSGLSGVVNRLELDASSALVADPSTFAVQRHQIDTTKTPLIDRLQEPLKSERSLELAKDFKLTLLTDRETNILVSEYGFFVAMQRLQSAAEELPDSLEGKLGEADVFGPEDPEEKGKRSVVFKLNEKASRQASAHRETLLQAAGGLALPGIIQQTPHFSVGSTRDHETALAYAERLNQEFGGQFIPVQFGPAEVL